MPVAEITFSTESLAVVSGIVVALVGAVLFLFTAYIGVLNARIKTLEIRVEELVALLKTHKG